MLRYQYGSIGCAAKLLPQPSLSSLTPYGETCEIISAMKRIDPDILVLKRCVKALNGSTSIKMLKANLEFLVGRFNKYELRPPNKSR